MMNPRFDWVKTRKNLLHKPPPRFLMMLVMIVYDREIKSSKKPSAFIIQLLFVLSSVLPTLSYSFVRACLAWKKASPISHHAQGDQIFRG